MKTRPFKQVDVFTSTPYRGNPLAIVFDGADLDAATMQHFARWTNLSETVFLSPPTDPAADYQLRIFTAHGELPFAGHPTLGACHAWLEAGGCAKTSGRVVQQCSLGLINIRTDGPVSAFEAPPLKRSTPAPALLAQAAQALGITTAHIRAAQLLDNGPLWLGCCWTMCKPCSRLLPTTERSRRWGKTSASSPRPQRNTHWPICMCALS